MTIPRPNLGKRPFALSIKREMAAAPAALYRAWTQELGRWFAAPETVAMKAQVDAPYFFETHFEGQRHPHYGRFLALDENRLVEMTWLNEAGTMGAETIVRVELEAAGAGTRLKLSQAGFPNAELLKRHEAAWPLVLAQLDEAYRS